MFRPIQSTIRASSRAYFHAREIDKCVPIILGHIHNPDVIKQVDEYMDGTRKYSDTPIWWRKQIMEKLLKERDEEWIFANSKDTVRKFIMEEYERLAH